MIKMSVLSSPRRLDIGIKYENELLKSIAYLDRKLTEQEKKCLKLNAINDEAFSLADEALDEASRDMKEIYIYGAGRISVSVLYYLRARNYRIKGFAVTKKDKTKMWQNRKVYDVSEIDCEKSFFVLGMNEKNACEVKEILESRRAGYIDLGFVDADYS